MVGTHAKAWVKRKSRPSNSPMGEVTKVIVVGITLRFRVRVPVPQPAFAKASAGFAS